MRGRAIPAVLALLLVAGCSPPPSRVVPAVPGLPPPPPQDLSGVVLPPGIAVVEGRIYCEKDGAEMVLVPAGEFLMGEDVETCSGDWSPAEAPSHRVRLSAYLIDRHPVTVGQFRRFCGETGRTSPPPGSDRLPVTDAPWEAAVAYAAWAGREMATEARWERAARGLDRRLYPGDPSRKARTVRHPNRTLPVGSFPGEVSPVGCLDMCGGPMEWCSDGYDLYAPTTAAVPLDPVGRRSPFQYEDSRVLRGGYWENSLTSPKGIYLPGIEVPLYEDRKEWRTPYTAKARTCSGPDTRAAFRCARGLRPRR